MEKEKRRLKTAVEASRSLILVKVISIGVLDRSVAKTTARGAPLTLVVKLYVSVGQLCVLMLVYGGLCT